MPANNRPIALFCLGFALAGCGQFGARSAGLGGGLTSEPSGYDPLPKTGENVAGGSASSSETSADADAGAIVVEAADPNAATTTSTGSNGNGATVADPFGPFSFGAIVDYDGLGPHGKQSVQSFVTYTGVTPAVVDTYVRVMNDGTFEGGTAKALIQQAANANVVAVCLSVTSEIQGKLSTAQLADLVSTISFGKSVGVAVQIRFGYEMNGTWSPSNSTNGTANAPANFLLQWAQVAAAVQAAGGKMVWSPNVPFDDASALARWQPTDPASIDIVAMDFYPKDGVLTPAAVRKAIATIYPIAVKLNKPFVFGESGQQSTGSSVVENDAEAAAKITWLNALTDAQVRKDYPLYRGLRWFDYQKYESNTWNNYSLSADPYARSAFATWYKTSAFVNSK